METSFHLFVCVLQVILACKGIVLCKCSGKYIDISFRLKITFLRDSFGWLVRTLGFSCFLLRVFFLRFVYLFRTSVS